MPPLPRCGSTRLRARLLLYQLRVVRLRRIPSDQTNFQVRSSEIKCVATGARAAAGSWFFSLSGTKGVVPFVTHYRAHKTWDWAYYARSLALRCTHRPESTSVMALVLSHALVGGQLSKQQWGAIAALVVGLAPATLLARSRGTAELATGESGSGQTIWCQSAQKGRGGAWPPRPRMG